MGRDSGRWEKLGLKILRHLSHSLLCLDKVRCRSALRVDSLINEITGKDSATSAHILVRWLAQFADIEQFSRIRKNKESRMNNKNPFLHVVGLRTGVLRVFSIFDHMYARLKHPKQSEIVRGTLHDAKWKNVSP